MRITINFTIYGIVFERILYGKESKFGCIGDCDVFFPVWLFETGLSHLKSRGQIHWAI